MLYPPASQGLAFTSNGDGTCYVSGIGTFSGEELVIPYTSDKGEKVVGIGESAFANCTFLKSVIFPDSVVTIGRSALFNCTSLETLTIPFVGEKQDNPTIKYFGFLFGIAQSYNDNGSYVPKSLKTVIITKETEIPDHYFYGCLIEEIELPKTITKIGNSAFCYCVNLRKIAISNRLESFGSSVFEHCESLELNKYDNAFYLGDSINPYTVLVRATDTSITECNINSNTRFIHTDAFVSCDELTKISIPAKVCSIGMGAFRLCRSIEEVIFEKNNMGVHIGRNAFHDCKLLLRVVFEENVNVVAFDKETFSGCSALSDIVFEQNSTLQSIGEKAFTGCTALDEITILSSVERIEKGAFASCTGLTKVIFEKNSSVILGEQAFLSCSNLETVVFEENCEIREMVSNVFASCTNLKNVIFKEGIKIESIGFAAFYKCSSIESFTIPDTVISIDNTAFYGCNSLQHINIPKNVTNIGSYAFYGCNNLKSLSIPESVTDIGDYAFTGCTGLVTTVYDNAFYIGNENSPYKVLLTCKDKNITSCTIHPDTEFISSSAFSQCAALESITIPSKVSSICSSAFSQCTKLASVSFDQTENLKSIGEKSFYQCKVLKSITIPNSVEFIGKSAFENCSQIENMSIPFVGQIKNLIISSPEYNKNTHFGFIFGATSYSNNGKVPSSLKTVYITDCNQFDEKAFYGCQYLEKVYLCSGIDSVPFYAFENCTRLKEIVIPDSVCIIRSGAFYGCSALESVTIPKSVTIISQSVFYNCSKLVSINYGGTKSEWKGISKGTNWNFGSYLYTVYCTDGNTK